MCCNGDLVHDTKCPQCGEWFPLLKGRYVLGLHVRVCSKYCAEAIVKRLLKPIVCIGDCKTCLECDGD